MLCSITLQHRVERIQNTSDPSVIILPEKDQKKFKKKKEPNIPFNMFILLICNFCSSDSEQNESKILKIYMGPLHHFTFKVNVQYLINTVSPCIFSLLNYTIYFICLKLLYLCILSISILQIVDIALQAELKIRMLPPRLGQHLIFSEIISHLCILVLNTLMCLLSYNCVV